jgi:hypothetical protein
MLVSLILASVAAAAPTSPAFECERSVSKLVSAADPDTRVVITFTGSQTALLPLDERADPRFESTLFPVSRENFVLTLQVRSTQVSPSAAPVFAQRVCSLGVSNGGRFNGVLSFKFESMTSGGRTLTRNHMTDAVMAEPPKN